MEKPFLKSKTIWWNLLTLLSISLVAVGDSSIITDNPTYIGVLAVVSAVVNVFLRTVTATPIK